MSNKKQTPLQEAIYWFQTEPEAIGRWNTDEIVAFLQPFIKKEQQTFSEIFDAGYNRRDFEQMTFVQHFPNKEDFLNQYKP